jgi:hypothetical protein
MRKAIIAALAVSFMATAGATSAFAFGAIAVYDEQGMSADEAGWGLGWGSTRKEAEANAIRECKRVGNDECQVAVWFEQCGAYAGDRVNFGIGYGSSQQTAEKMALESCPNCKIIVSECQ